jgi:hypothetical protein
MMCEPAELHFKEKQGENKEKRNPLKKRRRRGHRSLSNTSR